MTEYFSKPCCRLVIGGEGHIFMYDHMNLGQVYYYDECDDNAETIIHCRQSNSRGESR